MNSVKDEVKYEMQENANMAKSTGVPVSQNMVPAAGVGTHGTQQPHTGQASGSLKIVSSDKIFKIMHQCIILSQV